MPRYTKLKTPPARKINDSLYEFYVPPPGVPHELDIVFFHGLQYQHYRDAYRTTWTNDRKEMWPKTLLSPEFPNARILSVSYDSCVKETGESGRMDMFTTAEALLGDLIETGNVGRNCPVVLVGHSFGGLVMKMLVLHALERMNLKHPQKSQNEMDSTEMFLTNVRGVFYYATPNIGSRMGDLAAKLPRRSPVALALTTLNADIARLNSDFREWRTKNRRHAFGVGEAFETSFCKLGLRSSLIVEEASARHDVDSYCTVPANHVDICKPKTTTDSAYTRLECFIKICLSNVPS